MRENAAITDSAGEGGGVGRPPRPPLGYGPEVVDNRKACIIIEGPRTRVVYQKVKHGKLPKYCKNEEKCW